jgi:hypothetical protein
MDWSKTFEFQKIITAQSDICGAILWMATHCAKGINDQIARSLSTSAEKSQE